MIIQSKYTFAQFTGISTDPYMFNDSTLSQTNIKLNESIYTRNNEYGNYTLATHNDGGLVLVQLFFWN